MSVEKYFTFNFVNGLSGDPAIYVQNKKSGKAFLWDMAPLQNLSEKEQLKVERIFISHTHMDHFMGIDSLIRFNLPHKRPLFFYGPDKLAKQICNRLNSYVWNLIDIDAVCYFVTEITDTDITRFKISLDAESREFSSEEISRIDREDSLWIEVLENGDRIGAQCLNHINIDSVSYYYELSPDYKVNSIAVGNDAGPWISSLLDAVKAKSLDQIIVTPSGKLSAKEASIRYLIKQDPLYLAYITDIGFTKSNVAKLAALDLSVDAAFIESSFKDAEMERAKKRHHLTTAQSACLAKLLKAKKYYPFHFSQIYQRMPEEVKEEAQDFYNRYTKEPELFLACFEDQPY